MLPVTPTRFSPARLDVAAFAKAGTQLRGEVSWVDLPRLGEVTIAPADGGPAVSWSAQGLWRQRLGGAPEIRIRLQARATVWQTCQRCLEPVAEALEIDRTVRFVPGEDEAARMDEEGEEDVLALTRSLDLPALLEDELILALPLVPCHVACPHPLHVPRALADEATEAPEHEDRPAEHPFAVLKSLRSAKSS